MLYQLDKLGRSKNFCVEWEYDHIDMAWIKDARLQVAIEHEFKGDKINKLMDREVKNLLSHDAPLSVLIVYFRPKNFMKRLRKLKKLVCMRSSKLHGEFLLIASRQKRHHAPDGKWKAYRLAPGMKTWEHLV
jgi:hypothetical protein